MARPVGRDDGILTPDQVAARLDTALTRAWRIAWDVRQTDGLYEQVRGSRFVTNAAPGLMAELLHWGFKPHSPRSVDGTPAEQPPGVDADERIAAALAVCARHEHGALRWADPLPVPAWVREVREALTGQPDALAEP